MSNLFSKPSAPAPLPPDNSAALARARADAERAAIAESKMAGRRATIAGGGVMAAEDQAGRGLMAKQKREAARAMGL